VLRDHLSLLHPGLCDHTCDLSLMIPHTSSPALISLHHVGIDKVAQCSLVTLKNAIVVGAHNRVTFQLTYRFIPLTWTIVYREINTLPSRESSPFGRNASRSRPCFDVSRFPLPVV
jgi:hypothetical protein